MLLPTDQEFSECWHVMHCLECSAAYFSKAALNCTVKIKDSNQWRPLLCVHGVGVAAEADEKLHHLLAVVDATLETNFNEIERKNRFAKIGMEKQ